MRKLYLLLVLHFVGSVLAQTPENKLKMIQKKQEAIIEEFVTNCAQKYNYNYNMAEWQACLNEGLKKDSTVAYLWQQKAMPYFKAKKYEVGMQYIDKAVQYNPERWQSYRAFIKRSVKPIHRFFVDGM